MISLVVIGFTDDLPLTLPELYQIQGYDQRAGYVSLLVDSHVALILVDGRMNDWLFWVATPKSNPASRRIPLLLVMDDPSAEAHLSGADLVLSRADLKHEGRRLIRDLARVPDPGEMTQLTCECQEALPDLAQEGIKQFNAGEYYRQHDLFEELWMQTDGPVRNLYRAILQIGVAYYQIERSNHRGAHKMLMRSVQWLAMMPDECQGVNVNALRADSYRVRTTLEQLAEDQIDQFDQNLLQPVKLADC